MSSIRFVDKIMALVNFSIASFGFSYHFTEDWVISLVISVDILFATTILMCIPHEKELKDFEKSIGDKIRNRKAKRRMAYARQVQGQCHR